MKVLITKVSSAKVSVKGKEVSSIGKGLIVFAGLEKGDTLKVLEDMASKIVGLRVFEGDNNKMSLSLKDKKYQLLCISNFTLCANILKGRRPSFEGAMPKDKAGKYFKDFVKFLKAKDISVEEGTFGEMMDISLEMTGPVNITLGSGTEN